MSTETTADKTAFYKPIKSKRIVLGGAAITLFTLLGGLAVGLVGGSLTHFGLPDTVDETVRIGISTLPGLAGAFIGGMLWGWSLASYFLDEKRRQLKISMTW